MITQVSGVMRIHGHRTVALALSDGQRCEITDEQFDKLAEALRPYAYFTSNTWVEEVKAVISVAWKDVFEVQQ